MRADKDASSCSNEIRMLVEVTAGVTITKCFLRHTHWRFLQPNQTPFHSCGTGWWVEAENSPVTTCTEDLWQAAKEIWNDWVATAWLSDIHAAAASKLEVVAHCTTNLQLYLFFTNVCPSSGSIEQMWLPIYLSQLLFEQECTNTYNCVCVCVCVCARVWLANLCHPLHHVCQR